MVAEVDTAAVQSGGKFSVEPLFVSAADAAKLLGISQSKLYQLKQEGRFGPEGIRFGRAVRYDRHELVAWARAGAPSRERWKLQRRVG